MERTPTLYQPETLGRLRAGADVKSKDYILAQRQVEMARRTSGQAFAAVDGSSINELDRDHFPANR